MNFHKTYVVCPVGSNASMLVVHLRLHFCARPFNFCGCNSGGVKSDSKPSELLSLAWSLNAKLEHVVDQISALHEGLYTAATAALK